MYIFVIFGPIYGSFTNRTVPPNFTEGTKAENVLLNGNVCHGFTKIALNFMYRFFFQFVSLVVFVLL